MPSINILPHLTDRHITMEAPANSKYISLRVDNFASGIKTPVDLFARTGKNNYVKIYSSGEMPNKAKLLQHSGSTIKYLWVEKEHFSKLTRHNMAIAKLTLESSKYELVQKRRVLSSAAHTVFNEFKGLGVNVQSYAVARELSSYTTRFVDQHNDLSDLLENVTTGSDSLVKHSMAVSAMSLVICRAMDWKNPVTREKLAIGGLLHRIGMIELPKGVLAAPYEELSSELKEQYAEYPQMGSALLHKVGYVSEDVISIVLQHRERPKGKGFPLGLPDARIHPLAKVVGLAEAIVNLTYPNVDNNYKPLSPDYAYKQLSEDTDLFNKEIFKSIQNIFVRNALIKKIY